MRAQLLSLPPLSDSSLPGWISGVSGGSQHRPPCLLQVLKGGRRLSLGAQGSNRQMCTEPAHRARDSVRCGAVQLQEVTEGLAEGLHWGRVP